MVPALEMVRVKDLERASDSARVSAQTAEPEKVQDSELDSETVLEPDQALALEAAMK
jgi:hypothetical protein